MSPAHTYRAAAQQAREAYEQHGHIQAFVDGVEFGLMARHLECAHPCPNGCAHCTPELWCGTPRARQERLKLARWAKRISRAIPTPSDAPP